MTIRGCAAATGDRRRDEFSLDEAERIVS